MNIERKYIKQINESINDDYEDTPEEMHRERYVTYFETQEGRQKYTIYHVYTDSTDDSYNELCDKRDNQLGMYNSYKELKDALKERAEKIAKQHGWTVKSIDNLGEDEEYYRERNKYESINESVESDFSAEVAKRNFNSLCNDLSAIFKGMSISVDPLNFVALKECTKQLEIAARANAEGNQKLFIKAVEQAQEELDKDRE